MAKELNQVAICFTEHGNIYNWVEKKLYCEKTQYVCQDCGEVINKEVTECKKCHSTKLKHTIKPIKYMHGCEVYLTETLEEKIRDNYHTVLIAKNFEGFKELNTLIDLSTQEDHMYYKPRITFDEFLNISDNIIKVSACLQSPLNKLDSSNAYYERLMIHYDYLEVQPHINSDEQKQFNKRLLVLSKALNKPLIAGTDTHSINKYKADCKTMLQYSKDIIFDNEDEFDLSYKTYDELVDMFKKQNAIPEKDYLEAIDNTNVLANSVEKFKLDLTFKYPKLSENEEADFKQRVNQMYKDKLNQNIIQKNPKYLESIKEEFRVLKKIGMLSFMHFMSELSVWCHENDIPTGFCRGSVGGSVIAYIIDITDVDPIIWNTKFSRFANEDRIEIGDIDIDYSPKDRGMVFDYIIKRFGINKTSFILTTNTMADKGVIDNIVRGFANKYRRENKLDKKAETPYSLDYAKEIKNAYEMDKDNARKKYKEIFYYFDGMVGCVESKGIHPAGIIASPISLNDNYGTFWDDGKRVMSLNMEEVHEVSLVKYDILGLVNIGIIKETCKLVGIPYPKSHDIDWNDDKVWEDMITSCVGIFQFESDYSFLLLKKFNAHKINDLSLVNASLRPSGESYRDRLIAKEINYNPSEIIDELLNDNYGYLVFQEDVTKFLQDICGLSGSEADNVRRAIGRKQQDRLQEALPSILEGYCSKSNKPKEVAEKEAKVFLEIIENASSYMFGFNHSTGYSMIGYICAMLRYYYPLEFVAAYLNNADTEEDINKGLELARIKGISINPIKFRYSKGEYFIDKDTNGIYKGIASIKYMNLQIADELYKLRNNNYLTFTDLLLDIKNTSINTRHLKILIELDFFSEFGDIKKLLYINNYFTNLIDRKNISKTDIEQLGLTHELMIQHSTKVTDKTYTGIISLPIIKYFELNAPVFKTTLKEKINYQIEHLGYVTIKDSKYKGCVIIIDLETKFSPKLKVYALANGTTLDVKVNKKIFNKQPIQKGDIICIKKQKLKPKTSRNTDGSFSPVEGSNEWWLEEYNKIDIE
jgi:DNA polymerase-3 subunit alpha